MKPRPIKIQPGATHWNPNAGPDWYAKPFCGPWVYFDAEEGNWDNGQWEMSIGVKLSDLIPVQELMAQQPEWNGEEPKPVVADRLESWVELLDEALEHTYSGDIRPVRSCIVAVRHAMKALLSAGKRGE